MRKHEMTNLQLAEREQIIDKLTVSGWEILDCGDWFERGLWAKREATLQYDNKDMVIRIGYNAERRTLDLTLEDLLGRFLSLRLSYEERLADILKTIIEIQDDISPDNFHEKIEILVRNCPVVFAYTSP